MTPTLVETQGLSLAGLSAPFVSILSPDANNQVVIPALWDRFIERMGELSARREGVEWGVCRALPAGAPRSHPDELRYTAAAELVRDDVPLPEGFDLVRVPAGRYAVFVHEGRLERLDETLSFIHELWLPASTHALRDAPHLERYDRERFRLNSEDSELDLWIPID